MWWFPWKGATLVLCICTGSVPLTSIQWGFKTENSVTNVEWTEPFHRQVTVNPVEWDKKERNALIIWPFIDLVPAKGGEWGVPQKKSRLRYTWWWPIQKHWPTHIANICCLIHCALCNYANNVRMRQVIRVLDQYYHCSHIEGEPRYFLMGTSWVMGT